MPATFGVRRRGLSRLVDSVAARTERALTPAPGSKGWSGPWPCKKRFQQNGANTVFQTGTGSPVMLGQDRFGGPRILQATSTVICVVRKRLKTRQSRFDDSTSPSANMPYADSLSAR
jgi:hypothetical protein